MSLRRPLAYSVWLHLFLGFLVWWGVHRQPSIRLSQYYAVDFLGGGQPSGFAGGPLAPASPPVLPKALSPVSAPARPKRSMPTETWAAPSRRLRPSSKAVPPESPSPSKPSLSPPHPIVTPPGPGGAGGGEGGGIGIGFGPGSGVGMGLPNFPYAWYVNVLRVKLWEEWSRWVPPGSRQSCLVSFVIQRTGVVAQTELERASGDSLFDQGALRAVQAAAPFPPLPEGFKDPSLSVHVEFRLGT